MFSRDKSMEELSNSSTIIGNGTNLKGDVEAAGNLRVEGKLKGTVKAKSKLALGESALVEGDIFAKNAEIDGRVMGKVEVTELLVLGPKSIIEGDIVTNNLIVKDGAVFNGGCKMGVKFNEMKLTHLPEDEGIKDNGAIKKTA